MKLNLDLIINQSVLTICNIYYRVKAKMLAGGARSLPFSHAARAVRWRTAFAMQFGPGCSLIFIPCR